MEKSLVPPTAPAPKTLTQRLKESLPPQFSTVYWRNNKQFLAFLFFIASVNIIPFIHRAHYFKDFSTLEGNTPNAFYMLSRANGKLECDWQYSFIEGIQTVEAIIISLYISTIPYNCIDSRFI